jgi:hypothetical protein
MMPRPSVFALQERKHPPSQCRAGVPTPAL